jgi:AAHS family 3-hydroxyphenylpropionic acid transporter
MERIGLVDTAQGRSSQSSKATLLLCFLAAVIEGFDLQAAGVAAPKLGPAFGLAPDALGLVFSAAIFGLVLGALVGGRVSDRLGRKPALLLSLGTFGLFSLLTAAAWDYHSLLLVRFVTGLGLGGAFPNLIAIASEGAAENRRATAVATIYAGMPFGGAISALVSLFGAHGSWETVFIIGGIAPLLLLVPMLRWRLPDVRAAQPADTPRKPLSTLFAKGRGVDTAALWLASFCALLVLYLLLNWLPVLLEGRGIARKDALIVQIVFNLAGALASRFCGQAMDGVDQRLVTLAMAAGLIASLSMLALAPAELGWTALAAAAAGSAVLAMQAIIYALAPAFYAADIRGTAIGSVVAVGRLGSVTGPLLAGGLIAAGSSGASVLGAMIPVAMLGAATIYLLVIRRHRAARRLAA